MGFDETVSERIAELRAEAAARLWGYELACPERYLDPEPMQIAADRAAEMAMDDCPDTPLLFDPWAVSPVGAIPPSGPYQRPHLWGAILQPEDRALVATYAFEILAADPAIEHYGFGGRLLERVRTAGETAGTADELSRLRRVELTLSIEAHLCADLLLCARALLHRQAPGEPV